MDRTNLHKKLLNLLWIQNQNQTQLKNFLDAVLEGKSIIVDASIFSANTSINSMGKEDKFDVKSKIIKNIKKGNMIIYFERGKGDDLLNK